MKEKIKGLLLCLVIAVPAWLLGRKFAVVGGPVISILLGMIVGMFLKNRAPFDAGIKFTSKKILQWAVILLGFGMNLTVIGQTGVQSLPIILSTITTSLLVAFILCKALKIPSKISTLVGVGSSICGGLREGIDGGFNVLLVDQRAHGESEGKYLTFGVNERFDCLSWASYAAERFGNDVKIYLYGISMGASTVLMASALPLPKSVSGIVADCGYTSPKDIIFSVLRDHHVPAAPVYAVARLGAKLFCGFDLDSASAPDALSRSHIPVLFIHGDDDRFVPCRMSRENFEASAAEHKKLLIVHNAGHGLSYMLDRPAYLSALHEFLEAN